MLLSLRKKRSNMAALQLEAKEAHKLIKQNNITKPPIAVTEIAKALGINVIPYGFGDGVSGILIIEDNISTIGYSNSDSKKRQRFTIAHELGHYVLHSDRKNINKKEQIFVDKKFLVRYRGSQKYSHAEILNEKEANAFAAELLMPKSFIEAELSKKDYMDYTESELIEELANVFDVSVIAMSYRLANLNIYI